ncbi:ABC transporter permease [Dactylosporangium sp. NPDC051484]|uniref:branched-chain amino acid ABC transporter permease n=1 Tax=Dactylosporangium sp. NPDC051484 TaxID=3154942 RepID=UPI00344E6495
MHELIAYTIFGLVTAAIYSIAASGLVVTYTTSGVFNLAHGAFGMFAAFSYWQLRFGWGWPTWLALPLVVFVLAPLFGCGLERLLMRKLTDATEATKLAVTIGVMLTLVGAALWIWDPQVSRPFPAFYAGNKVEIAGVFVTWDQLITLALGVLCAVGLRLLLYRTRIGLDMRAVVDNRSLVLLNGGRPDRAAMTSWVVGSMLAALAGVLIAPYLQLAVIPLTLLVVNAYAAAVIGKLRSLPMTFAGALVIGLAQSYAVGYLPTSTVPWLQSFPITIPIIVLLLALLVLPHQRLRGHASRRSQESFPVPTYRMFVIGAGTLLVVAVLLAVVLPTQPLFSMSTGLGLGIIGLSLVPLLGYGGQISLCQMTFAGVGALTFAHAAKDGNVLGLIAAFAVAAICGAITALPAIRLRGLYLALSTAAVASFCDLWLFGLPSITVFGYRVPMFESGSVATARLNLGGVNVSDDRIYFVVLTVVFALMGLGVVALRRSRYGRMLLAMRESPAACATLGLRLTTVKLSVFALSAGMAGVGGALLAGLSGQAAATQFSFFASLPLLLLMMAGGAGMVSGALFGAVTLGLFSTFSHLSSLFNRGSQLLPGLVGLGLGEQPNGVAADIGRGLAKLSRRGAPAAPKEPESADHAENTATIAWEWSGMDQPLTDHERNLLDERLGIGAGR